jgi:hypothetical protein
MCALDVAGDIWWCDHCEHPTCGNVNQCIRELADSSDACVHCPLVPPPLQGAAEAEVAVSGQARGAEESDWQDWGRTPSVSDSGSEGATVALSMWTPPRSTSYSLAAQALIAPGTAAGAAAATATAAIAITGAIRQWRSTHTPSGGAFEAGGEALCARLRLDASRGSRSGYLHSAVAQMLSDTVCLVLGVVEPQQVTTVLLIIKAIGTALGAVGLVAAPIGLVPLVMSDIGPLISGKWRLSRRLRCAEASVRRRRGEFEQIGAFTIGDVLVICAALVETEHGSAAFG